MLLVGIEKITRGRRLREAAPNEDLGQHVADSQLALQAERRTQVVRRDRKTRLDPLGRVTRFRRWAGIGCARATNNSQRGCG
jgi:hypothetical protein